MGSNPWPPNGWHFNIRLKAKNNPRNNPCNFNDSIAYSEQVGKQRQFLPIRGEKMN